MKILMAKEIELFKNLSELELDSMYYDFHNDFFCTKILYETNILILLFKNFLKECFVSFKFVNATIENFEFFNFEEYKNLTVDNIYRGRFQKDGELLEMNISSQSYFYIEFYEGPKIELWCDSVVIDEVKQ